MKFSVKTQLFTILVLCVCYFAGIVFLTHRYKTCSIHHQSEFCKYFSVLRDQKNRYSVFVVAKEDAGSALNCSAVIAMQHFGLKQPLKEGKGRAYFALVENGAVCREILAANENDRIVQDGTLKDFEWQVESAGNTEGAVASVKINGKEVALNHRGLNIVVCDDHGAVKDSVCFDTSAKGLKCSR